MRSEKLRMAVMVGVGKGCMFTVTWRAGPLQPDGETSATQYDVVLLKLGVVKPVPVTPVEFVKAALVYHSN